MSIIQQLYDKAYSYLGRYASHHQEEMSLPPLDLQKYEKASEGWQRYTNQWIAVGKEGQVVAHGTLEDTLNGIQKIPRRERPMVFPVSETLFEKNVRFVGV